MARRGLLTAFARSLAELRLACGKPSYTSLENATLRRATMSDVLGAKVNPALDFVLAYVRACVAHAQANGHVLAREFADEQRWRERWLQLQRDIGELRRSAKPPMVHTVTRQLPAAPTPFLGRIEEFAYLDEILASGRRGNTMPIVVLDGMGGAGKTALAVAWGHRRAADFPDGQLFTDLGAFGPASQAMPDHVLGQFLRDLGAPDDPIHSTRDGLAARFRSLLAGRRALILLDNAASAEQVRPLLPATPACMVVITSRMTLSGLAISEGVTRLPVGPLPAADSISLLRLLGPPDNADDASIALLAEACAHQPLALRIAAERLVQGGDADLASLVEELRTTANLAAFQSPDGDAGTALRTVFSWSYIRLPADSARAFRLLSGHTAGHFGVPATAALWGLGESDALHLLTGLRAAHLVEVDTARRFRLHDLLRAYAAELATEQPAECTQAIYRLTLWYMYALDRANRTLLPGWPRRVALDPPPQGIQPPDFETYDAALAWCDLELNNLLSTISRAADTGQDRCAWQLAYGMLPYFNLRKPWPVWIATFQLGEAAARRAGDRVGVAGLVNGLGIAYKETGRYAEAQRCYELVVALYRDLGDRQGEGLAINNLNTLAAYQGRHAEAVDHARTALAIFDETRDIWGTAIALHNIADGECSLGRYRDALDHIETAIGLCRSSEDSVGLAHGLTTLGRAHLGLGDHTAARGVLSEALHMRTELGDDRGVAITLWYLGLAYAAAKVDAIARQCMADALAWFERTGDPLAQRVVADIDRLWPEPSS